MEVILAGHVRVCLFDIHPDFLDCGCGCVVKVTDKFQCQFQKISTDRKIVLDDRKSDGWPVLRIYSASCERRFATQLTISRLRCF